MYTVLVSATFAQAFRALPTRVQTRIREGLARLAEDPRTSRAGADIKQLKATDPPKHRLRVGTYRIIYRVEGRTVKVLDVFARERGYRDR